MSQKEEALRLIRRISTHYNGADVTEDLMALRLVKGESQNPPPQGKGDGSINETLWCQIRDFIQLTQDWMRLAKTLNGVE